MQVEGDLEKGAGDAEEWPSSALKVWVGLDDERWEMVRIDCFLPKGGDGLHYKCLIAVVVVGEVAVAMAGDRCRMAGLPLHSGTTSGDVSCPGREVSQAGLDRPHTASPCCLRRENPARDLETPLAQTRHPFRPLLAEVDAPSLEVA